MISTYKYRAFGLNISSEFEIPEFVESDAISDVKIKLGKTPENLDQIRKRGVKYQARKNEFLIEVDNVGRYYVKNGNEIVVETKDFKTDIETRLFLLGSAFGALFIQRGLLPIHGSAIKAGNSATIFSGASGAGKSSIAAHFSQNGYGFLADDISLVNHQLEVAPGFPKMKIWQDVLDKLNIKNKTLSEIRPALQKFHLPIEQNYYNKSLKLERIIIIQSKNTPGFEYEELSGIKKFNAVKNNTYRYRFVEGLEKQQDHFLVLNKLLPKIKVYRVSRPQAPIMLNEFADFLKTTFELNA